MASLWLLPDWLHAGASGADDEPQGVLSPLSGGRSVSAPTAWLQAGSRQPGTDTLAAAAREYLKVEHPHLTSPFPAIIQCLVRPLSPRRIPPEQAIVIDENDPAQHPPSIDPSLAVALGKIRRQALHLLIRQPIQAPCSVFSGA